MERFAIIMAGGAGERFWPLSRIAKPKHLWNVTGGDGCLLSQTFRRISDFIKPENILIITNVEQVKGILKECPEISKAQIIAEPFGRDTSAAIAFATMLIKRKSNGKESSFAVLPSDQVINNTKGFSKTLGAAFDIAEAGNRLVTIGIEPTFPSTGYGYIKRGKKHTSGKNSCFQVARFFEKPNSTRATMYLESGDFYWNAGIFVWKTSSISDAIEKNIPETYKVFEALNAKLDKGDKLEKVLPSAYEKLEKISIDFAVMEKADNAWVVPSSFDWDDVGSWSAIERHSKKDENRNISVGEFFEKESNDCVVFDVAGRTTALVNVKDLIVVHSKDATLICNKNRAELVKDLVRSLPQKYK